MRDEGCSYIKQPDGGSTPLKILSHNSVCVCVCVYVCVVPSSMHSNNSFVSFQCGNHVLNAGKIQNLQLHVHQEINKELETKL